jgi:hypothetical protein
MTTQQQYRSCFVPYLHHQQQLERQSPWVDEWQSQNLHSMQQIAQTVFHSCVQCMHAFNTSSMRSMTRPAVLICWFWSLLVMDHMLDCRACICLQGSHWTDLALLVLHSNITQCMMSQMTMAKSRCACNQTLTTDTLCAWHANAVPGCLPAVENHIADQQCIPIL